MIVKRTIYNNIVKRLKVDSNDHKVIIIYGARQVGKTTLVKQVLENIQIKTEYFNCDYLDVQSLFAYENAGNLASLIKNYELIILDEAQRIKNIGLVLKILHDEFPNLRVIATGSSCFDLSNQINEPLTGRKIVYHLYPLSFHELSENQSPIISKRNVNRIMRFGSYPSVILNDDQKALENINEITSSYLFKDVFEFQYLKKPEIITDLLKLLSFQISNEVSFTELSRKLGVDQTVIQRYIHLLEESFILFRLPALKRNLRNEVVKTRKIYFWDLGIRNAIIQNTNPIEFRNDFGALWENFCVAERLKFLHYFYPNQQQSYFWRTYSQKEIDYIEERQGKYKAFEFKWSATRKSRLPDDFRKAYELDDFLTITPSNFHSTLYSY